MTRRRLRTAIAPPGAFWVEPGRLLAGPYPGDVDPASAIERVGALIDLGINWFVDLTRSGELPPYHELLTDRRVRYTRHALREHDIPRTRTAMTEILDELEAAVGTGHRVYVHGRAGIGRTGLVIGCYLARRSGGGVAALAALEQLWQAGGGRRERPGTPETEAQRVFVREWREELLGRAPALDDFPPVVVADQLQDRYRGLLQGLALGDALAAPVQHRRPGSFTPVGDLLGGGPYDLPRGAWTDDTAVALVLADSLLETGTFDGGDFVARLRRWQQDGYRSATGQCLGITAAMARALARPAPVGLAQPLRPLPELAPTFAEPLVRAGVVAAWSLEDPARAIELAAEVVRATHPSPLAEDAGRWYAALVVGALQGTPRTELLAPGFTPIAGLWRRKPLIREVAELVGGGWRNPGLGATRPGADPPGAVRALALVFEALAGGHGYRDTVLAVVNQGLDADANGALVGQLAGALYGAAAMPRRWLAALVDATGIAATADRLLTAALGRVAAS